MDFYIGVHYTISPCIESGSGWVFTQWESGSGNFSSATAANATFTPNANSGDLYVEVSLATKGHWEGFVAGYADTTSTTSVNATIVLPSRVSYYGSLCTSCVTYTLWNGTSLYNAEVISYWVGLGLTPDIWQAGLDIVVGFTETLGQGLEEVAVQGWYEDYPSSGPWPIELPAEIGNRVNVEVSYDNSSYGYFSFHDYNTSFTNAASTKATVPTDDWGEWMMEDPDQGSGYAGMPTVSPAYFTNPGMDYTCTSGDCPSSEIYNYLAPYYIDDLDVTDSYGLFNSHTWSSTAGLVSAPYLTFTTST